MRRVLVIPAILALVAVPARVGAAPGTPDYQSSDPPKGAMEHQSVDEVSVTFNELLDPSTASLSVSACGEDVDNENVVTTGFTVEVGVEEHPAGTYVVSYSVSGADDTPQERQTPTEGSYQFAYHSEQCRNDDGTGNHDNHGGEHDGHGNDHNKGDGHGKHESGSGDGHKGKHGGHSGEDHTTTSHDGNSHEGRTHTSGHNSEDHGGGDHKKNHQGHRGGNGKKGHHSGRHQKGEHHGDAENNGGRVGSPSRPNDVLNLSLVLLLPALVGALGGRRLRRLHLRPSG